MFSGKNKYKKAKIVFGRKHNALITSCVFEYSSLTLLANIAMNASIKHAIDKHINVLSLLLFSAKNLSSIKKCKPQ